MINNNNIDNTDINKDNDNNDENNAQKKIKNITKNESPCQWSFLTITITITTNKTHITDKTLTREEQKLWKDYENYKTIIVVSHSQIPLWSFCR